MADDTLDRYRAKRDFAVTTEPAGDGGPAGQADARPRFVVQEHHARRLHWDLRLEHDGVAVSWAVPNGIPPTPRENRLAVHTEDHPLEYLEWHGEIPAGEYGAGTMTVWDRGVFDTHKWEQRKVEVTFHGARLRGRYGLFPIGRDGDGGQDWLIHRMDPPENPDRVPMPAHLAPMLARPGVLPRDPHGWSFEVKWDGVRAIAYIQPGRLALESRNQNDITASYPEVRGLLLQLGMREVVLDGELVAFDDDGRPSFGRLQTRMHVSAPAAVKRLATTTPVLYAIFDLLHLDGESLLGLPYAERRARLVELGLGGPAWRVPENHPGRGAELLDATRRQGLEGVIAKRLDSRYEPGARNGSWLKLKHTLRQELVIGGWLPGEGRRTNRIGALLVGHYDGEQLRFAGRVGTGFTETALVELGTRLAPLRVAESPFDPAPKLPRGAQFVRPELVAEVEFTEWTKDGVMRAPSFKGLRDDKPAREVVRELVSRSDGDAERDVAEPGRSPQASPGSRSGLFDSFEETPGGGRLVVVDGHELKLTNWRKVLFPATGFTKGDLVEYYGSVAGVLLPHLRGRALTLKRYPNGVAEPHFYEKQSPKHRPVWIPTASIGGVDYTLANERAALVWLAGLADIELHTSLALATAPQHPTLLVFDLDPGPPAGLVECCEVALVLRGMFGALGLESVVKTSGSKGLQVYVPLGAGEAGYEATKTFAKHVAELLEARLPELVVSRMGKALRRGKVLVDWSQNDRHKTTVTVYSVRALERPGVSTPIDWDEVASCRERAAPELLTFSPAQVLERIAQRGDLFAPAAELAQTLPQLT